MKQALLFGICLLGFVSIQQWHEQPVLTPYQFEKLKGFPSMPTSTDNLTSVEGAELGRFLFYDPILSRDSSISCASCHKQEYAFSDGGKAFSLGIDSQKTVRNTPPLFNLAWYPKLFWDGRANSIEEQVFVPVRDHLEMDLDWKTAENRINQSAFYRPKFFEIFGEEIIDSIQIAKAIAQFERTLISADSKLDKVIKGEAKLTYEELKGYEILNDQSMGNCLHCHPTDAMLTGTTFKFSNNGLENISDPRAYSDPGLGGITENETDLGLFKIPSLRNIMITAPYMHDGRFNTIEEVLNFYRSGTNDSPNVDPKLRGVHNGGINISEEDTKAVIGFLNCLTDSSFINNPEFANPFKEQK